MKLLLCIVCLLVPAGLLAQTRSVVPSDLRLWVEIEDSGHTPLAREMVLVTVRGIYRRHITLEKLVQPDFEGFNWTQLGNDVWREERLKGEKVKTFVRRMAVYPEKAGDLTIGAFTHRLTLTDESTKWFEHDVHSEPVKVKVDPAPVDTAWWFPVKQLKVTDQWSNPPDQLALGEGVLRVMRIEALGATPEMIPPMPTLTSPSAKIFAHPEKRFVELSPLGPTTFAFWRWTIQPGNDTSGIVEPISFDYFDTVNRVSRTVEISAQRVAYGAVVPDVMRAALPATPLVPVRLPGWRMGVLAAVICGLGVLNAVWGRRFAGAQAVTRFRLFDPLARQLRAAARAGQVSLVRRRAVAILRRDGTSDSRLQLLHQLDRSLFEPGASPASLHDFARAFLNRA